MTVRVNKQPFNIREKLSELERPIGVKGQELMRAETAQDARDLVSAGRKNLIINGAMMVAQRGTVVNAGNEYAGPDRMRFNKNDGAFTISQSTDVPTGQGFGYSWKADVTTVAGTSGNYYTFLQHRFEGQNFQSLKKGTSFAESFTLQFWIKSAVTGTYVVEVYDNDNNRSISQSYTVNSSNTWEHKILTFPGDATGALDNDNNDSLEINCWLFAGTGYSSGTLNTSWNTQNNANRAVGQVNAANNTSNDIYFTGFQLEVGKNATEFEHRSYGEELALCQRYYQVHDGEHFQVVSPSTGSAADFYTTLAYWVPMRDTPNVTQSYTLSGATTNNLVAVTATKAKFSLRPSSANTEIYVTADTLRLDAEL